MSHAVRLASVSEIPPGKGKLVELGGRSVALYNSGGTFHARWSHAPAKPAFETECTQPGLWFDVFAEDSPADLLDEEECRLKVEAGAVWLLTPERS